jgi:hypothetical protein
VVLTLLFLPNRPGTKAGDAAASADTMPAAMAASAGTV